MKRNLIIKRKLYVVGKHTCIIILGAALMCLLSSCAVKGKNEGESINGEMETVDLCEIDNEEKSSKPSNEQEQVSADISNGQEDDSSGKKDEQLPAPAEDEVVSYGDGAYVGEYNDYDNDEPNLHIQGNDDGTYLIQIGIFRLATMDDCVGHETESGIEFSVNDWDLGNGEIRGIITLDGDVATVTFTTGWNDEQNTYKYYKTSDISNTQKNSALKSGLSSEESYKTVLMDNGVFISTDLQNRKINLSDIKEVVTNDDSITVEANKFAIIDLNNDSEKEVILWIQINGVSDYGFEILRYEEGAVYGYTLTYREFMDLKTDGTFIFSSGAADSGIGKLSFSGNGYIIDMLYYSESQYNSNNELEVQYFANGAPYSEEEFNHDMSRQQEKSSVGWYDLTADNLKTVFE